MVKNRSAGLTPKAELDSEMEDASIALQARMMSKLMRKIVAIAGKTKTHVAFVNQVRVDIGGYKGPKVPTGGLALSYWASQRISFNAGFMNADDTKKGYDPEFFKRIDCTIKKNRCANLSNPYKKCSYYAEYGVGIDTIGEVPTAAIEGGIITVRGAWHYEFEADGKTPITLADGSLAKWGSKGDFRTYLRNHPEYVASITDRINYQAPTAIAMSAEEVDLAVEEEKEAESKLEELGIDLTEGVVLDGE